MPARPGKLLAGLEESRGALYEIGVSDDGTFVGLTKDEMDESLTNLRAMAASLGCNVEVMRMVAVGDCEWHESTAGTLRHEAKLWVAEALVTPDLSTKKPFPPIESDLSRHGTPPPSQLDSVIVAAETKKAEQTEQLRVTLTGPTTSGKSSLLGTLSTATLDNGRGKSRLSLLKHRHEIGSGVTSSVAQELIGYKDSMVVNYASGNVTSWNDVHASAENGRLVFFSDSPGAPRYRRTTVRGLIGWAPHWTVLCIAADDGVNASSTAGGTSIAQDILGIAGAGIDLAKAHLELCLKLDQPLVIVITKMDLASMASLRQTLSKILSAIKATGRTPSMLPLDKTKIAFESDLQSILQRDEDAVRTIVDKMWGSEGPKSIVPIIMTSSRNGSGIRLLHALLRNLPIPSPPRADDLTGPALNPEQPACLFHIADTFGVPASYENISGNQKDSGVVVAGYLRFGSFSVSDVIVVGPFPAESEDTDAPMSKNETRSSPSSFGASSHPSVTELSRISARGATPASITKGEWHNARIVSVRNLRLPVSTLEAGQVGTIGIVFDILEEEVSNGPFERPSPTAPRIRKGMVLAIPSKHMLQSGLSLQAATGFTASFEDSDINSVTQGSLVVVYIASIRASARVMRLVPHANSALSLAVADDSETEHDEDVFGIEDSFDKDREEQEKENIVFGSDGVTVVTLELLTNREWIELGSQVLVMPGGGHGLYYGSERGEKGVAGLEGFVGKVIEVVD